MQYTLAHTQGLLKRSIKVNTYGHKAEYPTRINAHPLTSVFTVRVHLLIKPLSLFFHSRRASVHTAVSDMVQEYCALAAYLLCCCYG